MSLGKTNPRKRKADGRTESFDVECGLGPGTFRPVREADADLVAKRS
jgi:hypothetical protein